MADDDARVWQWVMLREGWAARRIALAQSEQLPGAAKVLGLVRPGLLEFEVVIGLAHLTKRIESRNSSAVGSQSARSAGVRAHAKKSIVVPSTSTSVRRIGNLNQM